MNPIAISDAELQTQTPLCPVFGTCGGCTYQHLSYEAELEIKERNLRQLLQNQLGLEEKVFEPIVASPKTYHYRNRLDIAMRRSKGELLMGFQSPSLKKMISIEACPIAMQEISDFIPQLREEAASKFPPDYRTANLVVRTGDDGRVYWGGIGRRSLRLAEENYLWTEIEGRKIFYSLETFFQANLSILPQIIQKLRSLAQVDAETLFLDLYAGVGLFGLCMAEKAAQVLLIEESPASIQLARYNVAHQQWKNVQVRLGRVEEELPHLDISGFRKVIAMIDPPRGGLSPQVAEVLSGTRTLNQLFYLSCHPESLARDLAIFLKKGWQVAKVIPFDFFPRTAHLETLVQLTL